jgi:hypothetical protein
VQGVRTLGRVVDNTWVEDTRNKLKRELFVVVVTMKELYMYPHFQLGIEAFPPC